MRLTVDPLFFDKKKYLSGTINPLYYSSGQIEVRYGGKKYDVMFDDRG